MKCNTPLLGHELFGRQHTTRGQARVCRGTKEKGRKESMGTLRDEQMHVPLRLLLSSPLWHAMAYPHRPRASTNSTDSFVVQTTKIFFLSFAHNKGFSMSDSSIEPPPPNPTRPNTPPTHLTPPPSVPLQELRFQMTCRSP